MDSGSDNGSKRAGSAGSSSQSIRSSSQNNGAASSHTGRASAAKASETASENSHTAIDEICDLPDDEIVHPGYKYGAPVDLAQLIATSAGELDSGASPKSRLEAQEQSLYTSAFMIDSDSGSKEQSLGAHAQDQRSKLTRSPVNLVGSEDFATALQNENSALDKPLSVYVHLPFCPSRCLTCDHETTVSHDHRQIDEYLDSLAIEVELAASKMGGRRRLQQLHLGGGTPNYLSEIQLVRLIDILDQHFVLDEHTETSLEANAHRASVSQLALLHGLGFRELNLEVRDLDPGVQKALGRHQSLPVVRDVVEHARNIGFSRVSTDLVYGLPKQTLSSMRNTVEQLLALDPDHISCYRYARRPESFSHQSAVNSNDMPSLGDKVAVFSRIVDGLCDAGYQWVGIDCFAKQDSDIADAHRRGELHRNRIGYTTRAGHDMLGFGSSSFSDLSQISVRNFNKISDWSDAIKQGRLPVSVGQLITPETHARRVALSDLMCNLELNDRQHALNDAGHEDPMLTALRQDGIVEVNGDKLRVTAEGRYKLHQLWGDASPTYRWAAQG